MDNTFINTLDPFVAEWYKRAMGSMTEALQGYDRGIQGAAVDALNARGQAHLAGDAVDTAMAAPPAENAPMANFYQRLFGNVSQAIAPQLGGADQAERNIGGQEGMLRQRQLMKLQRLEQFQERMIARAEKMGDTETALKLAKEQYKTSTEAENLQKAGDLELKVRDLNAQQAHNNRMYALQARGAARDDMQFKVNLLRSSAENATTAYKAELDNLTKLEANKKNKPPGAIMASRKRLEKAYEAMQDAYFRASALEQSLEGGQFNPKKYASLPKSMRENIQMNGMRDSRDLAMAYMLNNHEASGVQFVKDMMKQNKETTGVDLTPLEVQNLRAAWKELRGFDVPMGEVLAPEDPFAGYSTMAGPPTRGPW